MSILRPALVLLTAFTVMTGLVYPLVVTAVTGLLFPHATGGSLLVRKGVVVGSELVGQRFTSERHFHGRPSAAGADGYDAAASSGSNLGPTSAALMKRIEADVAGLREAGATSIPADAVTSSGSGLDPHVSPETAHLQVAGIAAARGVEAGKIQALVEAHTEGRALGLMGEPRVNVLRINLALDAASEQP
jgi:K+-transporting ATPase ATPase C chain